MNMLQRFWNEEEGVTMLEYAVIAALILAVVVGVISGIGQKANTALSTVNAALP